MLLAKSGDVITFDPALFIVDGQVQSQTMTLQHGELKIASSVSIVGMIDETDAGGALTITGSRKTNDGEWSYSSMLSNNTGQRGGAIYQSDGELWLDVVEISDNVATWGGGLYQAGGKAVLTEKTMFAGNSSDATSAAYSTKCKTPNSQSRTANPATPSNTLTTH